MLLRHKEYGASTLVIMEGPTVSALAHELCSG